MCVVVHKQLTKLGSSIQSNAMAQTDLTLANLLVHLCHLHPASLYTCRKNGGSAWLQLLCGRAITG